MAVALKPAEMIASNMNLLELKMLTTAVSEFNRKKLYMENKLMGKRICMGTFAVRRCW